MARLAAPLSSSSRANTVDSLYRTPSVPPPRRDLHNTQASPGSSSDKENQSARRAVVKAGKMPAANRDARGSKRRRLGERNGSVQYESSASGSDEEEGVLEQPGRDVALRPNGHTQTDNDLRYDPHQSIEERRELRKNLRDLDKEMQDSRNEWLAPDSRDLENAVKKQNLLFGQVKQTSDATIDSRMLVNAGDLTHKRTKKLNVAESAQGIDVDEFVGKCISFMDPHGTRNEVDEDGNQQDDAFDWSYLGRHACFPSNSRPPTIGFLLGPLAVQKRVRQPTQRKARAKDASRNVEAVTAKELKSTDLQSQGNTGLVAICNSVKDQFMRVFQEGHEAVHEYWDQLEKGEVTEEQQREFEEWTWIMPDAGVNFFKFALHPTDFGQSAENLFSISFMVKDDVLKIAMDEETGMPSLHLIDEETRQDSNREKGTRHQAVLALDFPTWEGLVKEFNVTESMIPDRSAQYEATQQPNATGWYG